jgi:hypothetical protein
LNSAREIYKLNIKHGVLHAEMAVERHAVAAIVRVVIVIVLGNRGRRLLAATLVRVSPTARTLARVTDARPKCTPSFPI